MKFWKKKERLPDGGIHWKKILLEIYEWTPDMYGQSNKQGINDNSHPLAKKLKITGDSLMRGISLLKEYGLLEEKNLNLDERSGNSLSLYLLLTEKGFDVALDLEKHSDSKKVNFGLVGLTSVLVLTGAMDLIRNLCDISEFDLLLIYVSAVAILAIVIINYGKD